MYSSNSIGLAHDRWPAQMAFSQQPISKGQWTYKNGKPESVTFDYGTELTAKEVDRLSNCTSLTRIVMGYAGIDSEYVEIEGDLLKLGRLKNLKDVHLNKDGINDDDLKFVALLPKIHTLEFNADNGYDGAPVCTDQCADHLSSAKTLRSLVIHDGTVHGQVRCENYQGLARLGRVVSKFVEIDRRITQTTCRSMQETEVTFHRIRPLHGRRPQAPRQVKGPGGAGSEFAGPTQKE